MAMDTQTTALANFTASTTKVKRLLAQKKLTVKDIKGLNKIEREYLEETFTGLAQQLKGEERDDFFDKIDLIIPASTKSDIWEYNHSVINNAVAGFMGKHGIMPTIRVIAEKTGLSRKTVARHFSSYKRRPEITAEMEQFKFMAPRVLANVFKFALNGDIKAARLYFEMVGAINKKQTNTVVNEQNNYIQINNTILSQENLKQLTAEQLNQIERIITNGG
jgi:hypothetical protein